MIEPMLTSFQKATEKDCLETFSDVCLFPLRTGLGGKTIVVENQTFTPNPSSNIIVRLFMTLIAFSVWLPMTLLGMALIGCSNSYAETFQKYTQPPRASSPPASSSSSPAPNNDTCSSSTSSSSSGSATPSSSSTQPSGSSSPTPPNDEDVTGSSSTSSGTTTLLFSSMQASRTSNPLPNNGISSSSASVPESRDLTMEERNLKVACIKEECRAFNSIDFVFSEKAISNAKELIAKCTFYRLHLICQEAAGENNAFKVADLFYAMILKGSIPETTIPHDKKWVINKSTILSSKPK